MFIVFLTIISLLIEQTVCGNNVLVVGKQSSDCPAPVYSTIQQAVDAALAGQTIEVCGGTYAGATINKKLNVKPVQGKRPLIIEGVKGYIDNSLLVGFLILPGADGTSIRNFQIEANFENSDQPGIGIETIANNNIEIRDNFISGAFIGIRFTGGSNAIIEHNYITDIVLLAIRMSGITMISKQRPATQNSITQNTFSSSTAMARGIMFFSTPNTLESGPVALNDITDNDFFFNAKTPFGIALSDNGKLEVMLNTVQLNYLKGGGIYVSSPFNTIVKNDLEGSFSDAIVVSNLTSADVNVITENSVRKGFAVGIRIDGDFNLITNNFEEQSKVCGLSVTGKKNIIFPTNKIGTPCVKISSVANAEDDSIEQYNENSYEDEEYEEEEQQEEEEQYDYIV